MQKLFVYGILRFPKHQKRIFGRAIKGKPARLHGYRKTLRMMPDGRYFVVLRDKDHFVKGMTLEVSPQELKRADAEEIGYRRVHAHLPADGYKEWVYTPKYERHYPDT